MRYVAWVLAIAVSSLCIPAPTSAADAPVRMLFVVHGAFFSLEFKQPTLIDPHVFVKDPASEAGTGPQKIMHAAGFRPAHLSDNGDLSLFNAEGKALNFTLSDWLAPRGSVEIFTEPGGKARVVVRCTNLLRNAKYSLFENHFKPEGTTFTPLDGTGTANSFESDSEGRGQMTVIAPHMLTHENAVLLVYHSDGIDHGMQRGTIGVNAHHQIIARLPL